MVAAFDYCLHGKGGAAPSIDTAMHGLVDAAHVDHLHPDSGIALACAADGEKLTAECFGDKVAWVPWRRPGFQLGLDIAAVKDAQPAGRSAACSAATASPRGARPPRSASATPCSSSAPPRRSSPSVARPSRSGRSSRGTRAAPRGRAPGSGLPHLAPLIRGLASTDRPQVGHFDRLRGCARLPRPRRAPAARRARHLLPRPLPAYEGPPARPRPAARRPSSTTSTARLRELHAEYREEYARLLRSGTPPPTPPRCAARTRRSCWSPASACSRFGKDKQTARVAGEFYLNAINVMRGAEAVSSYAPIEESEKFRIEYWALEEAKLRRMPKPKAAGHPGRPGHRRAVPASARRSPSGSPPRAPAWWSPT